MASRVASRLGLDAGHVAISARVQIPASGTAEAHGEVLATITVAVPPTALLGMLASALESMLSEAASDETVLGVAVDAVFAVLMPPLPPSPHAPPPSAHAETKLFGFIPLPFHLNPLHKLLVTIGASCVLGLIALVPLCVCLRRCCRAKGRSSPLPPAPVARARSFVEPVVQLTRGSSSYRQCEGDDAVDALSAPALRPDPHVDGAVHDVQGAPQLSWQDVGAHENRTARTRHAAQALGRARDARGAPRKSVAQQLREFGSHRRLSPKVHSPPVSTISAISQQSQQSPGTRQASVSCVSDQV